MAEFLLQHTFSFEDDELIRNAAYCLGVMCHKNPLAMAPFQERILAHLTQSAVAASSLEAKENILAALCKMVIGGNNAPLDALVADLFGRVPFTGDLPENKTLLRFYFHLCASHSALAQNHLPSILASMVDAILHQKQYELSNKFIALVAEKLKLLAANSEQAKQIVSEKVLAIQDANEKARVMALL